MKGGGSEGGSLWGAVWVRGCGREMSERNLVLLWNLRLYLTFCI